MKDVAIFMCHQSGIAALPWAEAGYHCLCVDIDIRPMRKPRVETVGAGSITFQWGDCRTYVIPEQLRPRLAFYAGEPPCTHVAGCNARDYKLKGNALLRDSLELFNACYQQGSWSGVPFRIENPVGKFSDHMREPDHYFHPWQYGDLWTKKTCLWTGNGYSMPPATHAEQPDGTTQKIWLMTPSDNRGEKRSETPPGFARAEFIANGWVSSSPRGSGTTEAEAIADLREQIEERT